MELILQRDYFPEGTNGELLFEGQKICNTIELPWKDNKRQISCIPEGRYRLLTRCNQKFGWHLWVTGVPDRDWILMHPATNALLHLKGCIAPVTKLTGHGLGAGSREALNKLLDLIHAQHENDSIF